MARIGFDGLMISPRGTGHARSERHSVEALAARGEHELVVFVREPGAEELLAGLDVEVAQVDGLTIDWELRGLPRAARRHRLDAFLSLSERLPFGGSLPVVVWLFESPLHRIRANREAGAPLRHRSSDLLTAALWRRSLRRAAHVAMGSHATEEEVLAAVPELRGRTSVVYPGVPPGFGPGPAAERPEPYVLHLGSRDPRDDTATAVEAARRAGVHLVVAGDAPPVAGAELVGRVSDEELAELYRGAVAFVHPARYEGFGYAVLEAMACGAPVVASRVTSIPEVVGDAGLLCEPGDVEGFAASLRRLREAPELAGALRQRGFARAAGLTWDETAAGLSRALAYTAARRHVELRVR